MASRTVYTVQSFTKLKNHLKADPPKQARDEEHALLLVERLAATKAGVIALRAEVDEEMGDYGEPTIVDQAGEIPQALLDAAGG